MGSPLKSFCFESREAKLEKSLCTLDLDKARKIVQAKNDTVNQSVMNLVVAKTFLRLNQRGRVFAKEGLIRYILSVFTNSRPPVCLFGS